MEKTATTYDGKPVWADPLLLPGQDGKYMLFSDESGVGRWYVSDILDHGGTATITAIGAGTWPWTVTTWTNDPGDALNGVTEGQC
tara:strand:+ start:2489 stop:2743 length:255 start_codon:yes stop_codon:yes gene_type:complete